LEILCPVCRQVTAKKFDQLPKNRYILQFLELQPTFQINNINNNESNSVNLDRNVEHKSSENLTKTNLTNELNDATYYKKLFDEIDVDKGK
jgi:hypothetical protein